ncbi:MAG: hypothetical protein H7645_08265 [Candidatus Heimdallarchaeota archaeon]|nr:hypothetical protein [Candidatus Heimdallarchaeota archaeon]MCK4770318.1 hypothetical protein [Candidatus Heimdallarchaeota archaeon]
MSERVEKDLEKIRREIENLENEVTNFKESLEGMLDLQRYYQVLTTLIQNKFIALNENLKNLIDENKNKLEERTIKNTSDNKDLVQEWTESQKATINSKFSETNSQLGNLRESIVSLLSESKTKFGNYTTSFNDNINTVIGSHTQDLERLANNQINTFRKVVTGAKENVAEIKDSNIGTFEKNTEDMKIQLNDNINITENIMLESIKHLRSEYGDKLTENMESIFESFNRIKNELEQLVSNAVKRIQSELSGVSDTMDKYLVDEITKVQDVLAEYEKGMIDVNEVAMSNFNNSKADMIKKYDGITKEQIEAHSTELQGFEQGFNKEIEQILTSFSEQSDTMKQEAKTLLSNEKDQLNAKFTEMKTDLESKISDIESRANSTIEGKISSIEQDVNDLTESVDRTSSQIVTRLESVEKDAVADLSSSESAAKGQIIETQETTLTDLETEAKQNIKLAEESEKRKRDLISRLERLEKNIEAIKNELYR